jgi:hypothetical protein
VEGDKNVETKRATMAQVVTIVTSCGPEDSWRCLGMTLFSEAAGSTLLFEGK